MLKDVSIEDGILHLVKDNKDIATTEMAESLAVNIRTIQRVIDDLKDIGVVERKGGWRYGYREILD